MSNAPQKHWLVELAQIILQIVTLIAATYAASLGARNHDTIKTVEANQSEVSDRADATKVSTEQKLQRIEMATERTEAAVTDTLGPQLWATAQYLQQIADESGALSDRVKAEEARRAYVGHIKRQGEAKKNGK